MEALTSLMSVNPHDVTYIMVFFVAIAIAIFILGDEEQEINEPLGSKRGSYPDDLINEIWYSKSEGLYKIRALEKWNRRKVYSFSSLKEAKNFIKYLERR